MGNKLAFDKPNEDSQGPGESVVFFQSLTVKWLSVIATRIREIKQSEISLQKPDERLKWNEYFKIFSDIKDKMVADKLAQTRNVWHPATLGYSMGPENAVEEAEEVMEVKSAQLPDDDYTDDDPSEVSDNEEDEEKSNASVSPDDPQISKSAKSATSAKSQALESIKSSDKQLPPVNPNWNSSLINPIYFGYNNVKTVVVDAKQAEDKATLKVRENRAISKAKDSRSVIIDALEKNMLGQAANRRKKMDAVQAKYTAAKEKGEIELKKNKQEMPPIGFETYKVTTIFVCVVLYCVTGL